MSNFDYRARNRMIFIDDVNDPCSPKYWMYETSGILQPVITAYLHGASLTDKQSKIMRLYLTQWIDSPVWGNDTAITLLRESANLIQDRHDIDAWLRCAEKRGIDPL